MMKKVLARLIQALVFSGSMSSAFGQISDNVIKIGVLNDQSGIYADLSGIGSVTAARLAVEDFGGMVLGKPIEIVYADSQNKADVAAAKAREWIDVQKVDVLVDVAPSNVALAVLKIAEQKNKIALVVSSGSTAITNEACTPVSANWMWDTHALSVGTAAALLKQGGDSWFFLTADYTFGKVLEKEATDVITASGGKVVGSARHPISSPDFSGFLLQAKASKAKVIGLANAGGDTVNTIKQAYEYRISEGGQIVAPLLMLLTDVHATGLKVAQGMLLTEGFYWDYNDESRAWSQRYFDIQKRMPTMVQAGVYSAVLHYLKAIKASSTDDTTTVMKRMREMPVSDAVVPSGRLREDGRMVHDMLLLQVKKPSESTGPWDYYHVKGVIPGDQAFKPLSQSTCRLVKK